MKNCSTGKSSTFSSNIAHDQTTISTIILRPLSNSLVKQQEPSGQYSLRQAISSTLLRTLHSRLARLFAEKFSNLSIDVEGVLSMMSKVGMSPSATITTEFSSLYIPLYWGLCTGLVLSLFFVCRANQHYP